MKISPLRTIELTEEHIAIRLNVKPRNSAIMGKREFGWQESGGQRKESNHQAIAQDRASYAVNHYRLTGISGMIHVWIIWTTGWMMIGNMSPGI